MRQYKLFIIVIQVIVFVQNSLSGFERTSQPTALLSRAFTGAAMYSSDNVWINPASIGRSLEYRAGVYYTPSPFQLEQLSNYGLVLSHALSSVHLAYGLQSFGFSLYKESIGSVSAAVKLSEDFTAGMSLQCCHIAIENYGSSTTAVTDIGAIYSCSELINIGVSLQNLTGSSFGSDDDLPQTLLSGISFRPDETTSINIDLVKDIRYDLTYRVGIEFTPIEYLTFRCGTDGSSQQLFGGFSVHVSGVQINYGIAIHSELGMTHSFGISFGE